MKSNIQKQLLKFQTPELFEKINPSMNRIRTSENKIKSCLILLFVMFSSHCMFSQTYVPDTCSRWLPYGTSGNDALLFLQTCETPDGTFGYLEIKNETEKDVKLHYVINFNNGNSISGDVKVPYDDKISKIECPNCIQSVGSGIASWSFERIIYEGQPGY